jgi:hypothetical protein
VRRIGQTTPDATTTINVTAARDALPASCRDLAVAQWDANNAATMWQDLARTTPSGHSLPVRVLDDALGTAGNAFIVPAGNMSIDQAPYIDIRKNNYFGPVVGGKVPTRNDPTFERPALIMENGSDAANRGRAFIVTGTSASIPVLGTMQGSFSVLLVCYFSGSCPGIFAFAKTSGSNYTWNHSTPNSPCIMAQAPYGNISDANMRIMETPTISGCTPEGCAPPLSRYGGIGQSASAPTTPRLECLLFDTRTALPRHARTST